MLQCMLQEYKIKTVIITMNYTLCLSISQFSTAMILHLLYNSNNHAIIIFLQCSVSFCDYY